MCALSDAVTKGRMDTARLLIEWGADINMLDQVMYMPRGPPGQCTEVFKNVPLIHLNLAG